MIKINANFLSPTSFGSKYKKEKHSSKKIRISNAFEPVNIQELYVKGNKKTRKKQLKTNKDGDTLEIQNTIRLIYRPKQKIQIRAKTLSKPEKEEALSSFPLPKFGENPTPEERAAYVDSIEKFLRVPDKESNIKAIEAVGKYGDDKQAEKLIRYLGSEDDDICQALAKAYADLGDSSNADFIVEQINNTYDYKDETYLECLNTLKKITKFTADDTQKDKDVIIKPITSLLTHKSEKVRNAAQETLDFINENNVLFASGEE